MLKFRLNIPTLSLFGLIALAASVSCTNDHRADAGVAEGVLQWSGKGDRRLPSSEADLAHLIRAGEKSATEYSVRDFFRNPDKTDFRISPDGTWFSYLGPYQSRMNIFVQRIGDTTVQRITSETDRDIAGYLWASDHRLLYARDQGGDENFRLYGIDIDGSDPRDLTPYDSVKIRLIDELREDPDEVIIGMNKENKSLFEPYRLNVHTGEAVKLASNDDILHPVNDWMTDHDGNIRMAERVIDGVIKVILYRDRPDEEFHEVLRLGFEETFEPILFDFDRPDVIYAASNIGRDKEAIVKYDLRRGREIDTLFAHPDVDVNRLRYSAARRVITYAGYTTDKTYRHFFDPQTEAIYDTLESRLPGRELFIVSSDRKETRFLVRTYSDRSRGAYYFYDRETGGLHHLVDLSPWIREADMAPMQPIRYQSRDGLTIHGYLTLPLNRGEGLLPVVVNPHGGPWARNKWGFNPEVQLFASQGYAVLQMNFRGSTGYGREFWGAAFKQWGRAMQNDITDGVQWLIDEGIADPDRIAIYGGSYGGYAALAGAAFTPDLYACAVDYVGVSNLHTFLAAIPAYWEPYREMMYEMIGDPKTDSALLANASPVHFVDSIRVPLFVAQGANDPRVNIAESDQIVRALRDRDIQVPYMVKYDEGHGFRNEENRFEFYYAMMGFLDQHLNPRTRQRFM